MSDLKPCPFCGNTDIDPEEVMTQRKDGTRYSYPGCGVCHGASERWNDRVVELEVSAMSEWISELPEESGCYWWKDEPDSDPEVVLVFRGEFSSDVYFRGYSIGADGGGKFWSEKVEVPK